MGLIIDFTEAGMGPVQDLKCPPSYYLGKIDCIRINCTLKKYCVIIFIRRLTDPPETQKLSLKSYSKR